MPTYSCLTSFICELAGRSRHSVVVFVARDARLVHLYERLHSCLNIYMGISENYVTSRTVTKYYLLYKEDTIKIHVKIWCVKEHLFLTSMHVLPLTAKKEHINGGILNQEIVCVYWLTVTCKHAYAAPILRCTIHKNLDCGPSYPSAASYPTLPHSTPYTLNS